MAAAAAAAAAGTGPPYVWPAMATLGTATCTSTYQASALTACVPSGQAADDASRGCAPGGCCVCNVPCLVRARWHTERLLCTHLLLALTCLSVSICNVLPAPAAPTYSEELRQQIEPFVYEWTASVSGDIAHLLLLGAQLCCKADAKLLRRLSRNSLPSEPADGALPAHPPCTAASASPLPRSTAAA